MIWLTEEDRALLKELEGEISKGRIRENWGRFIEHPPHPLREQGGGIIRF